MSNGWIKLHRELVNWEWYRDANTMRVFLHVMLMANHKAARWQGIEIERGQLVTSYSHLASALGLSVQNVRTSISKLKKSQNLTVKSTSKYTVLSVCNYETYQSSNEETNTPPNKPLTNNQQTTNKQLTTNKKDKNEKKEQEELTNKEYKKEGFDAEAWEAQRERFLGPRKPSPEEDADIAEEERIIKQQQQDALSNGLHVI